MVTLRARRLPTLGSSLQPFKAEEWDKRTAAEAIERALEHLPHLKLVPVDAVGQGVTARWLGGGDFGTVVLAKTEHNELVAVKFLLGNTSHALKEAQVEALQVSVARDCDCFPKPVAHMSDPPAIVSLLCNQGSLADVTRRGEMVTDPLSQIYVTYQVSHHVSQLSGRSKLVHRDIKPENILVHCKNGNRFILLGDPGLAQKQGVPLSEDTRLQGNNFGIVLEAYVEGAVYQTSDLPAWGQINLTLTVCPYAMIFPSSYMLHGEMIFRALAKTKQLNTLFTTYAEGQGWVRQNAAHVMAYYANLLTTALAMRRGPNDRVLPSVIYELQHDIHELLAVAGTVPLNISTMSVKLLSRVLTPEVLSRVPMDVRWAILEQYKIQLQFYLSQLEMCGGQEPAFQFLDSSVLLMPVKSLREAEDIVRSTPAVEVEERYAKQYHVGAAGNTAPFFQFHWHLMTSFWDVMAKANLGRETITALHDAILDPLMKAFEGTNGFYRGLTNIKEFLVAYCGIQHHATRMPAISMHRNMKDVVDHADVVTKTLALPSPGYATSRAPVGFQPGSLEEGLEELKVACGASMALARSWPSIAAYMKQAASWAAQQAAQQAGQGGSGLEAVEAEVLVVHQTVATLAAALYGLEQAKQYQGLKCKDDRVGPTVHSKWLKELDDMAGRGQAGITMALELARSRSPAAVPQLLLALVKAGRLGCEGAGTELVDVQGRIAESVEAALHEAGVQMQAPPDSLQQQPAGEAAAAMSLGQQQAGAVTMVVQQPELEGPLVAPAPPVGDTAVGAGAQRGLFAGFYDMPMLQAQQAGQAVVAGAAAHATTEAGAVPQGLFAGLDLGLPAAGTLDFGHPVGPQPARAAAPRNLFAGLDFSGAGGFAFGCPFVSPQMLPAAQVGAGAGVAAGLQLEGSYHHMGLGFFGDRDGGGTPGGLLQAQDTSAAFPGPAAPGVLPVKANLRITAGAGKAPHYADTALPAPRTRRHSRFAFGQPAMYGQLQAGDAAALEQQGPITTVQAAAAVLAVEQGVPPPRIRANSMSRFQFGQPPAAEEPRIPLAPLNQVQGGSPPKQHQAGGAAAAAERVFTADGLLPVALPAGFAGSPGRRPPSRRVQERQLRLASAGLAVPLPSIPEAAAVGPLPAGPPSGAISASPAGQAGIGARLNMHGSSSWGSSGLTARLGGLTLGSLPASHGSEPAPVDQRASGSKRKAEDTPGGSKARRSAAAAPASNCATGGQSPAPAPADGPSTSRRSSRAKGSASSRSASLNGQALSDLMIEKHCRQGKVVVQGEGLWWGLPDANGYQQIHVPFGNSTSSPYCNLLWGITGMGPPTFMRATSYSVVQWKDALFAAYQGMVSHMTAALRGSQGLLDAFCKHQGVPLSAVHILDGLLRDLNSARKVLCISLVEAVKSPKAAAGMGHVVYAKNPTTGRSWLAVQCRPLLHQRKDSMELQDGVSFEDLQNYRLDLLHSIQEAMKGGDRTGGVQGPRPGGMIRVKVNAAYLSTNKRLRRHFSGLQSCSNFFDHHIQ